MTPEQATRALWRAEQAAAAAVTDAEVKHATNQILTLSREIRAARWEPYGWQHPHLHPPDWPGLRLPDGYEVCDDTCARLPSAEIPNQGMWLELGGRGTGKTEGASHYVNRHAQGPPCDTRLPGGHRMTIVAPTQGDAVDACVEGPSGLKTINPGVTITTSRDGTVVRWPNGARARLLGASSPQDVDRLRAAGNSCLIWLEELAAQRRLEEVIEIAGFGLRIGPHPHWVGSTTPKNRPVLRALMAAPDTIHTRGRTRDATRLNDADRKKWQDKYSGTTLGRQELDGEIMADIEGALWVADRPFLVDGAPNTDERPGIDNDRVTTEEYGYTAHGGTPPVGLTLMHRVIIAVDPPGGRTECGIVVVGSIGTHAYPLADLSLAGPPDTWAKVALQAYLDYGAEGIAAEHAYGGDMVDDVLTTRVALMRSEGTWPLPGPPPIFKVPTKVGKRLRAEPVQALYQQHRVHHVGRLPGMESEQTGWVPDESPESESPNRLDALVHGVTYLLLKAAESSVGTAVGRIPRR